MLIHLHQQVTTTPKVRAAIQASDEPASTLAERFGIIEQTMYKWRHRDNVHDRSHTLHRLRTTLTPAEEAVAVAVRTTLPVSPEDYRGQSTTHLSARHPKPVRGRSGRADRF